MKSRIVAAVRKKTTHGKSDTKVYWAWQDMIKRCCSESHKNYSTYGGRGILVCDSWMTFEGFYKDMGDPPIGRSIDRINNDGNYEPLNCRWATSKEQASNKRTTRKIYFMGEEKSLSECARYFGVTAYCLQYRLKKLSADLAFSIPFKKRKNPNRRSK